MSINIVDTKVNVQYAIRCTYDSCDQVRLVLRKNLEHQAPLIQTVQVQISLYLNQYRDSTALYVQTPVFAALL